LETLQPNEGSTMGDSKETTGRVKQAAGTLTGNKDLEREGKVDRAEGGVKDAIGKVGDKARDAVKGDDD
jgi:uncharacterized protein YjbJ (UPF0337 family)